MKATFRKGMKEPFLLDTSTGEEMTANPDLRRRLKILEYHLNKGGISWETLGETERRRPAMEGAVKAGFAAHEAEKVSEMVCRALGEGESEERWP